MYGPRSRFTVVDGLNSRFRDTGYVSTGEYPRNISGSSAVVDFRQAPSVELQRFQGIDH